MSENEVKKCSKCGSESISKKRVNLLAGSFAATNLGATAYICDKCGYIELYRH